MIMICSFYLLWYLYVFGGYVLFLYMSVVLFGERVYVIVVLRKFVKSVFFLIGWGVGGVGVCRWLLMFG